MVLISQHRYRHRRRCRYHRGSGGIVIFLFAFVLLLLSFIFVQVQVVVEVEAKEQEETNLYKILGVSSKHATIKEIKKAYRKKALDTHPDKNKDIPAEEAAAQFQKVVHAFEVLSDVQTRKQYDRTGRAGSATDTAGAEGNNGSSGFGGGGFSWHFQWANQRQYQRPKLKDRFDVKEAQSRILHIVSLEQLETIITTDDDDDDNDSVLERNLLICFYTPPLETHVMDEMVFPWPFAAKSAQGIWWEDLLQTTVVRYHRSNKITEFFQIPEGNTLKEPIFVFAKRGTKFKDIGGTKKSARMQTDQRMRFDHWVWTQLQVEVTFINHHSNPIHLYWINNKSAILKKTIKSNERTNLITMLSHEWWARDATTDTQRQSMIQLGNHKLTDATCLYSVKIVSDTRTDYIIPLRTCYDFSGHCTYWNKDGKECARNPRFMHEMCGVTCKVCTKHNNADDEEEEEEKEKEKENSDQHTTTKNRHDGEEL